MPKYPTNSWRAREALMDHEPYTTGGAMRAIRGSQTGWFNGNGRLPAEWAERYRADEPETVYTVVSYRTPIAWVLRSGEVIIPDVKYSRTTSGHQGLLYVLKLNGPEEANRTWRADIREAAQRERQAERDKRAERNARRVEQDFGSDRIRASLSGQRDMPTPPLLASDGQQLEAYSRNYRIEQMYPRAELATEDPTASVADRIAALEAETFGIGEGWSESIPEGDIVQRINDALSGL